MNHVYSALWFFLPAGIANATPVFAAFMPGLRYWNTPLDLDKSWRGKRILGKHKTLRGLVSGVVMATIVFWLQRYGYEHSYWLRTISYIDYGNVTLWLGFLLGFGALIGDVVKSFYKRLGRIAEGTSWFPFDQIDYILGGIGASLLVVRLAFNQYLLIGIVWLSLHLLASYIGYLLGLKKQPI